MPDAEKVAGSTGVYISLDTLKAWREDAEQRANRADSHVVFAARIVRLIDALEAPCGSCHPCNNWANQTWVNAGERLPHLHEWQEVSAEAHNLAHEVDRVRERLWRLAALAGWRPGNPADNDATAELYVTDALKTNVLPPGAGA